MNSKSRRMLRRTLVVTALLFAVVVAAVALLVWLAGEPEDQPFEYGIGQRGEFRRSGVSKTRISAGVGAAGEVEELGDTVGSQAMGLRSGVVIEVVHPQLLHPVRKGTERRA